MDKDFIDESSVNLTKPRNLNDDINNMSVDSLMAQQTDGTDDEVSAITTGIDQSIGPALKSTSSSDSLSPTKPTVTGPSSEETEDGGGNQLTFAENQEEEEEKASSDRSGIGPPLCNVAAAGPQVSTAETIPVSSGILTEAEEYADDLVRELINDSNKLVRSDHSSEKVTANSILPQEDLQQEREQEMEETQRASATTSNSPLVNTDSEEKQLFTEMEFTKNYSDDLLIGQTDGNQQGEMPSGGVDLADFELPPYSGSSSGSEPRQQSPAKQRKSSSSSSAQQASSSHQVAPPSLTAVRDLLMSNYSRVSHVFHWKKPIETGIIFSIGLTLIVALSFFSIISVVAYTALGAIIASGVIRFYKTIMKMLNKSTDTPFDHVWNKILDINVSMSPDKMHELVDSSLGNLNASLIYFKQVILVEDKFATLKFALFLYLLTYIGAWFNGMTLITITYFGLFLVPFLYEKNRDKIDEYINLATGHLSSTISMVTSKASVAFGSAPVPSTSGTKKQN